MDDPSQDSQTTGRGRNLGGKVPTSITVERRGSSTLRTLSYLVREKKLVRVEQEELTNLTPRGFRHVPTFTSD
jgi:hypothetical protein